jgi:hypothetical protein
MGLMAGVQLPAGTRYIFLLDNVQTDSGTHPAPYTMGIEAPSPGIKSLCLKLTAYFRVIARSNIMELYLHFSISLHAVIFNQLSARTSPSNFTLPTAK